MSIDLGHYSKEFQLLSVDAWQQYSASLCALLSDNEINSLLGVAHSIDYSDIRAIYPGLAHFLLNRVVIPRAIRPGNCSRNDQGPVVIGLTGSVSVGKSTAARFIKAFLSALCPEKVVALIPTDNFLFSNAELKKRDLIDKKGFPESFDNPSLLRFMQLLCSGCAQLTTPVYSHHLYDIDETDHLLVDKPDIVILEGLNLLQVTASAYQEGRCYWLSDYIDFSLFLDADEDDLQSWFLSRVLRFAQGPFKKPSAYFHELSQLSEAALMDFAREVWLNINLANYRDNILPFRHRAHMIIEKGSDHTVRNLWLR